jgi:hypothetical protein
MEVENKTKWNTKQLIKLMRAVIKREGFNKPNKVRIQTSKNGGYGGLAYRYGQLIVMKVPKTTRLSYMEGSDGRFVKYQKPISFNSDWFAKVFIHELGHLHGLHDHKDMLPIHKIDCNWARAFKVFVQQEKSKAKRNIVQERYEKAKKMVKEKQTIIKRNQSLLKKWQKKVKYYEKKVGDRDGSGS